MDFVRAPKGIGCGVEFFGRIFETKQIPTGI